MGSTSGVVDSSDILELLLMKKELETINEYGSKELRLEKGTAGYKEAVKEKSSKAIDYYRAELEVKSFQMDNPDLFDENGKVKNKVGDIISSKKYTESKKEEKIREVKKIKDIQRELSELKSKKESSESDLKTKGPIVNVKDATNRLFI